MKKSSDKRNPHRFVPGLFTLESREVPAGNIQAFVANGVLTIRSDDDFHAFSVSGAGGNNVVIRPFVGTTINGQTENIWVGGVRRGYDIQTGNGADTVIISGVNGRDYLS